MVAPASIVIPTRGRPDYLRVALASVAPQAQAQGAELLVVDDDVASDSTRQLVQSFGARYLAHGARQGLNVARNTGVAHTSGDLVVLIDDDVEVRPGWLAALLDAAATLTDVDVFSGPIYARLEGPAPRSCGREKPPITALDLGPDDRDTVYAWGANMALRRSALQRVGAFDVTIEHGGDEQEWQDRLRAEGPARVRYVAGAAVDHRRVGPDARLRSLARSASVRGRAARRFDERRGVQPGLVRELVRLAGCLGHVVRYRCPAGLVMVAHSAGRLAQAVAGPHQAPAGGRAAHAGSASAAIAAEDAAAPVTDDFLSGASGTVGGLDGVRRQALDALLDAGELLSGRRTSLTRAARKSPPRRRVLVIGVERPEQRARSRAIRAELLRSRHQVELALGPPGSHGKFENLNALLAAHPAGAHDWLLVIDDDITLPRGFLDHFLFLCERFSLDLAQPAQRLASHAAWAVTRRQPGSVVRETSFVEIGPATAFAAVTFPLLLPFPPLRMGWGLDVHWAAVARRHGWRCGVVDAVAIGHREGPVAAGYPRAAAIEEARRFLRDRPYLPATDAGRTHATHRHW